jgi:hypothetical protein
MSRITKKYKSLSVEDEIEIDDEFRNKGDGLEQYVWRKIPYAPRGQEKIELFKTVDFRREVKKKKVG